jgi:hypothetical protein
MFSFEEAVTWPLASVWKDLGAPIILAVAAALLAAAWPWWQIRLRGARVQRLIERELEEIAPHPDAPVKNVPWWEHLRREFVHEELFAKGRISTNRDFLLSLDADLVYKVSQLWLAFRQRNHVQWLWFMEELANDDRVGSKKLTAAQTAWSALINAEGLPRATDRGRDAAEPIPSRLLDARLASYASLFELTEYGPKESPRQLADSARAERATTLRNWYYAGGGLLLSNKAFPAFRLAQAHLTRAGSTDSDRWTAFSRLRTELKVDLGVRDAAEREIEMGALPFPSPG